MIKDDPDTHKPMSYRVSELTEINYRLFTTRALTIVIVI